MKPPFKLSLPGRRDSSTSRFGLWVDDLHAAVRWLEEQGVRFTPGGIRKGAAGHEVCFIHPKGGGAGVLIVLVQAPPEVIQAHRSASSSDRG